MTVIETTNLSKTYYPYRKQPGLAGSLKAFFKREVFPVRALQNLNLCIEEGELVGFLGPNGAGKTTTLKMLSGILDPTSGQARVLGFTPARREKEYQKQFSLVMGQKNQLWEDLPALETFLLNKEIYEIPDEKFQKNLKELVELLAIQDILDIQVRKLSLGQRMKCELVASLLHKPKILFLDEPTIGLDVVAQKNIREFLKFYNQREKTTIILTSHYMEDIQQLCERIVIINVGKKIYDGKLSDLIQTYAPYKILKLTFNGSGIQQNQIKPFGEILDFHQYSCTLKVPGEKSRQVAIDLLSSTLPVDDILIDEVEVDDVIRQIFQKA